VAFVHATDSNPRDVRKSIPSQVMGVDERNRHAAGRVNCSLPLVVVLSVIPLAVATQLPVTVSDPPVIGAEVQGVAGIPMFSSERSSWPETLKHDVVSFQVPTMLPPQAVTFGEAVQDAPPLEPDEPPELDDPLAPDCPELDPPLDPLEPEPDPPELDPELAAEPDEEPELPLLGGESVEPDEQAARTMAAPGASRAIQIFLMFVTTPDRGEFEKDSAYGDAANGQRRGSSRLGVEAIWKMDDGRILTAKSSRSKYILQLGLHGCSLVRPVAQREVRGRVSWSSRAKRHWRSGRVERGSSALSF
jgi:hypothetical protein